MLEFNYPCVVKGVIEQYRWNTRTGDMSSVKFPDNCFVLWEIETSAQTLEQSKGLVKISQNMYLQEY